MPFGSKCPGSASVRLAPPACENHQHFKCNDCGAEFRELLSAAPSSAARTRAGTVVTSPRRSWPVPIGTSVGIAPASQPAERVMGNVKKERRSVDRPLKRVRQLHQRLDALLRDARDLRTEVSERTRHALVLSAMLRRKRGSA